MARRELGLDETEPVACVLSLVEQAAGLPVVVTRSLPDGVAGACRRRDGNSLLFVNGRDASTRQRFTLAHELGHVRIGHDAALPVESWETLSGGTTNRYEAEANAFAGQLLVPREALEQRATGRPTMEDLVALAAEFGVSAYVALFRLRTWSLIDADRAEELQRELDEGLHREVEPPPYEDRIAALDELPYLSPGLERLRDALERRTPADARLDGAVDRVLR
jgi:Zn-dependent peptidase ImmA (M78 family)